VRRHPLISYLALAFAITWLGVLPLVIGAPVPPRLHAVGALGPVAAALLVTAIAGRPGGLRALWRATTRWRASPGWLALTLASPLVLFAVAALITRPDLSGLARWRTDAVGLLDLVLVSVAYGFGEEPGWRGFALPRLQRRYNALVATLILAVIWAVWHAPFFAYRYPFEGPGAIAGFVASLVAGALWLTFLYNSTGGSVLAVALWHTLWDLLNLSVGAVAPQTGAVANMLVFAVAAVVIWLGGPRQLRWSRHRNT
jgi:membrane protease YdiL (CAAX protease family)